MRNKINGKNSDKISKVRDDEFFFSEKEPKSLHLISNLHDKRRKMMKK